MAIPEVRIALVGFGSIARTHLSAIRALPAVCALPFRPVVDTIVTARPAAVGPEAEALGVRRVVADLDEALADETLTLFDVTSRNDRHLAEAGAILDAGRALYLEKPIGRTAEEAETIAAKAERAARPSQAGLVLRYHPAVAEARALVALGALGELRQGRLANLHGSYLDPRRPMSWRLRAASAGGGAMLDLGVHPVDAARFVAGDLRLLDARARTIVEQRPALDGGTETVDVDDWAWALFAAGPTGRGARVAVEASRVALGAAGSPFELYGTEGSLVGDLAAGALVLSRLDGRAQEFRARAAADPIVHATAALRPPARLTLGSFVDGHLASIHHLLLRVAGDDPAPAQLAPTLAEAARAERLVHDAVAAGFAAERRDLEGG